MCIIYKSLLLDFWSNYSFYVVNILYFTSCLLWMENTLEMQQYEISKEYITNALMNYTNIQILLVSSNVTEYNL